MFARRRVATISSSPSSRLGVIARWPPRAALQAARELAQLTPVQLEAARAAESQAQARYRAGLATLTEVADTQRSLAQAEIDDGLAKLNVWRALLAQSTAEGDLEPFLRRAAP
jgi:outer membrane protein TolC